MHEELCCLKLIYGTTGKDILDTAFLSYADVLFDDLLNKSTIISRIRDMAVSARKIERRITDIAKDVNNQQSIALKTANVFSVALDESIDINDNPR